VLRLVSFAKVMDIFAYVVMGLLLLGVYNVLDAFHSAVLSIFINLAVP